MVVKLNELSGKHYIMLKSLESMQCINGLSSPFKQAFQDLQKERLIEQAPGYIVGIAQLNKDGREILSIIRDTPQIKKRLDGEAKKILDANESEIRAMMLKLIPNLLRSQGQLKPEELKENFGSGTFDITIL